MRSRVASLVLIAVPALVGAQNTPRQQAAATRSEPKTWTTPYEANARPRDAYADQQGRVWFVGQEGNYVAYFEPEKGTFKKFEIEAGTNPHNLVVDKKGTVWFTGNRNGRIVKMDPNTGKLTNYPMPDPAVKDPHTMIFDDHGDAWFTAQSAGVVGKLTTATGHIRLWNISPRSRPYGIVLDSKGRPYFDEFGTNKIGTIDPQTGELKEYMLPAAEALPRRIGITDDTTIWYGDYRRGYLGRLNPKTGDVKEWLMPGGAASLPYGMTTDDRGRVWVAETGTQPNKLHVFDPKRNAWTESITIAADGPNTIRHMQFDKASRQIWFAADANMVARIKVSSEPVVP
jgi:virginiamycin B lyase